MVITVSIAYAGTKPPSVVQRIDKIFSQWNKPQSAGCSASAVLDGETLFSRGYGMADLEHGIPNSPDTVFNIASASKQFTAFAIHLLVEDGKLSLEDEVRKYLPELHNFDQAITVRHLLSHTSGLRDYGVLFNFTGWRYDDALSQPDFLSMIWRQRELNFAPGAEWMYSNTNYVLLGIIVERVSGLSLPTFAKKRIFDPLGMSSTFFENDYGVLVSNRAMSYAADGNGYRNFAMSDSVAGSSNLLTTARDLQLWHRNFESPRVGNKSVMARMVEAGRLNNGHATSYASGLMLGEYRGARVVEHGGGLPGFRSELMRIPDLDFSVAVLCNAGNIDAAHLAREIADIVLVDKLKAVAPATNSDAGKELPAEVHVDRRILEAYVGEYQLTPTLIVTFSLQGEQLMQHITGQANLPVFAAGERAFFVKEPNARWTFDSPGDSRRSNRVVLKQNGWEATANRVERTPPRAEQLDIYVGDYYSAELNIFYKVIRRHDGLFLQWPRGEFEFERANLHVFAAPPGSFAFQCSDGQFCSGFLVTNPRMRNLRFEHVEIRPVAGRPQ